ncbi:MAG: PP2C family protein-serine/threonine phosphatase, partial [Nanoarchaeota archaeon]
AVEDMLGVVEYAGIYIQTPELEEFILAMDIKAKQQEGLVINSFKKLRRLIDERIERHHVYRQGEIALKIQQDLLPTIPKIAGMDIEGICLSQENVGGDVFNVLVDGIEVKQQNETIVKPEKISCYVIDAEGHGIPAAMRCRDTYQSFKFGNQLNLKVAEIMESTNKNMTSPTAEHVLYTTAFYMEIFCLAEEVSFAYANAGHPSPIHYQRQAGKTTFLTVPDPSRAAREEYKKKGYLFNQAFGMFPKVKYIFTNGRLGNGDTVLLYSDGITEARNPQGDLYGQERLARALIESNEGSAKEISKHILAEVNRFCRSSPADDDRTVLVVKRLE